MPILCRLAPFFHDWSGKGKSYYHESGDSFHMLKKFHHKQIRAVLWSFTQAVLPRNDDFHLPLEEEILAGIHRALPALPLPLRLGLPLGLYLLEFGPVLFMGKLCRFSRLNSRNRDQYLRKWIQSPLPVLRDLMKLMKGLVMIHFYDDPRAWNRLGYFIEEHIHQVNDHPAVPARLTVTPKHPVS